MSFLTANYGHWEFWAPYDPANGYYGAHKCVFDGINRLILVSDFVTELDIKEDVYSDWKEWQLAGNTEWPPAIRTTGGDPTVSGQFSGDIYFLINGWKLLVDLTKVRITGVLFSDDFESAYYDYDENVQFPVQVSSIVNVVETQVVSGGVTAQELADAVWDEPYSDHDTDGTMGHLQNYLRIMEKAIHVDTELVSDGDGSQEFPYNNITSAIDRAEVDGIRNIYLAGDIVLDRNVRNLTILGIGVPEVDCNGYDLKNTKLFQVKTKGAFTGTIIVQESVLLNGAFLNGFYENCSLAGNLTCVAGADVFLKDCASGIAGTNRPTISMNAGGTATLSLRGYNGGMTIKDCNSVTDRVTVEMNPGSLTFDASCTSGVMVARGIGKFVDETNGATVVDETINREYIASQSGGGGNALTLPQFIALKD
jgi:hypothetical protein